MQFFGAIYLIALTTFVISTMHFENFLDNIAIEKFQKYIKIDTSHPPLGSSKVIDYSKSTEFLLNYAKEIGIECKNIEISPLKNLVLMTIPGRNSNLPTILLNSHVDVVSVYEKYWTFPPFSGEINHGRLYGRGTQDMKCVGIQYLEAIRRLLQNNNWKPNRTIHISFVPEEEVGGVGGMIEWIKTESFKELNIGFALDEGISNPEESFDIFYDERVINRLRIHVQGNTGHGSLFIQNSAVERMSRIISLIYSYRREQESLFLNGADIGDVTTVNINFVNSGVADNIVPGQAELFLDCRITPNDYDKFEYEIINKRFILPENQDGLITYSYKEKDPKGTPTPKDHPYLIELKKLLSKMKIPYNLKVFPGGTDSRFLRRLGIPAIGFSPIRHTPVLLHAHDEYLEIDVFLEGIKIYMELIKKISQ